MNYTIFDAHSGSILRTVVCDADALALQVQPGEAFCEGHIDMRTHYLPNGKPTPLKRIEPVVHGTTISNLPAPCRILVEGQWFTCADGFAEVSFGISGTYTLQILADTYQPCTIQVTQP